MIFFPALVLVQLLIKEVHSLQNIPGNHLNDTLGDFFTTLTGSPIVEKFHSLTVGKNGPMLLQDREYIEELAHFDRERIPERVVHAQGTGAYGYLEITSDTVTQYSKAKVFSGIGKRTKLFARFSTAIGFKGVPEATRNPRGLGLKIYTEEGNWDILCLSNEVFFIRDPRRFPSFIHAANVDPKTNLPNSDYFWDFISLTPESLFATAQLFTDAGTPATYRHANYFPQNTFTFINDAGTPFFCRFMIRSDQGIKNYTELQASIVNGQNPFSFSFDLLGNIDSGNHPSWTLMFQVMTMKQAAQINFNPLDPTKRWPKSIFQWNEIGRIVLDRTPENFFAEVEQAGFSPGNLVPGIEPSPDRILQGRLFSYPDTQRYRIGTNFHEIPINRPIVPVVADNVRDGQYCYTDNGGSKPSYIPNSFGSNKPSLDTERLNWFIERAQLGRFNNIDDDNFSQLAEYLLELSPQDFNALVLNLANELCSVRPDIVERTLLLYSIANADLSRRVRDRITACQQSQANPQLMSPQTIPMLPKMPPVSPVQRPMNRPQRPDYQPLPFSQQHDVDFK